MNCAFCGEEVVGRPVRQNGQIFCSTGCAEMASEIGLDDSDYDADDNYDDDEDDDYPEDPDEY